MTPKPALPGTILVVASLLSLVSSCSLSRSIGIVVELPELPSTLAARFTPEAYRVGYLDPSGAAAEAIIGGEERRLVITIPRSGTVPVVAEAVVQGVVTARLSCGGFSPVDDSRDGVLSLTWEEGFLASFLLRYFAATGNGTWFDLAKLRTAIREVTDGNPWNLDAVSLAVAFEWYALSCSALRKSAFFEFDDLLPAGSWHWIDPLALEPLGDRPAACRGLHGLFDAASGEVAELFVGREEWTLVFSRDPGSALSGRW